MEFVQYQTGTDDEGRRLDKVLRILFPDTPLSAFYGSIRKGLIRINQKKVKQDYHISSGDVIYVADFLAFSKDMQPEQSENNKKKINSTEVGCIFRNRHILVLNKPFDIPVHETCSYKGITLNQIVLEKYNDPSDSLSFKPGPLHRLDRKTTGLIVFSQSIKGAHEFSELLKRHEIKKHYLSIVEGKLSKKETYTDFLSKDTDENDRTFHTVKVRNLKDSASYSDEKQAVTTVTPLSSGVYKGITVTLVDVEIETGRMHQIRSQCASHGFPLLGDTAYGSSFKDGFYLHAYKLELPQPNSLDLPDVLFAPLPERFLSFIENYLSAADLSLYNEISQK